MTTASVRNLGRRFLALIDSDSIRPAQAVMYGALGCSALYVLLVVTVTQPTSSPVRDAMGWPAHLAWCCTETVAPMITGVGVALTHRACCAYTGMILQLAGDFCVTVMLATYTFAIYQSSWRAGAFGLLPFAALTLCAALLTFRSSRRLWLVEQLKGVM